MPTIRLTFPPWEGLFCHFLIYLAEKQVIKLTINDMTCGGCVASITRLVTALDGDAKVSADVATKRVTIDSPLPTDTVVAAITEAGYHPQVVD